MINLSFLAQSRADGFHLNSVFTPVRRLDKASPGRTGNCNMETGKSKLRSGSFRWLSKDEFAGNAFSWSRIHRCAIDEKSSGSVCGRSSTNKGRVQIMKHKMEPRRLKTWLYCSIPQHFLYFFPLPQEHGSFLPGLLSTRTGAIFFLPPSGEEVAHPALCRFASPAVAALPP